MRAVVIAAPGQVGVESLPDPEPLPGQVVVQVAATGLCGTDLLIMDGEHGRLPVVPGHELAGTVVACAADVSALRAGDRVAVDPSLPCGACGACRGGRPNLCPQFGAIGVTAPDGAAEYVAAGAASCVVLPDDVPLTAAPLIEPLACAVHAMDLLGPFGGSTVLLYGAGTIGLLTLALLRRGGAAAVAVVDTNPARHATATALGAGTAAAAAGDDWDVVIDATGSAAAIQDGLGRVGRGGTFLQVGVARPAARVEISPHDIYEREIRIIGSMAIRHSFQRAAELFATGLVDPGLFLTGQLPLEAYGEAVAGLRAGAGLKTVVTP